MDNPVIMSYMSAGITEEESLRFKYLSKMFNFEIYDSKPFVTLNERLNINKDIHAYQFDSQNPVLNRTASAPIAPMTVMFGVGTGAANVNSGYIQNTVTFETHKDPEFPKYAIISNPETYADDKDTYALKIMRITPVAEGVPKGYRMHSPAQVNSIWYRNAYLKETVTVKDTVVRKNGVPMKAAQFRCTLTKKDLINTPLPETDTSLITFNELTLYIGVPNAVRQDKASLPSSYFDYEYPTTDVIDVVPFYHVVFNDISYDAIPDNGLEIIIEIITHQNNAGI